MHRSRVPFVAGHLSRLGVRHFVSGEPSILGYIIHCAQGRIQGRSWESFSPPHQIFFPGEKPPNHQFPSLCVLFYFFTFFSSPHKHFLYPLLTVRYIYIYSRQGCIQWSITTKVQTIRWWGFNNWNVSWQIPATRKNISHHLSVCRL